MVKIGIKWQHKDSGVYEVVGQEIYSKDSIQCAIGRTLIWYKDQKGGIHVDTEEDFLDSFKPYEPVYEYQWAYVTRQPNSGARLTVFMTEEQFTLWREDHWEEFEYQRLDFTKRERK